MALLDLKFILILGVLVNIVGHFCMDYNAQDPNGHRSSINKFIKVATL